MTGRRCKGKVRHRNRQSAIIALKRINNAGLDHYPCKVCGGWHLGNTSNPVKQQARISQLLADKAEAR